MDTLVDQAKLMSRYKKERYLKTLSEDDFRDIVVRPLFLRRGFGDGRDFCGTLEKGKYVIFTAKDLLGLMDIYAVQTKKGNLNLGKKTTTNILEVTTQLKTALNTQIYFVKEKEKKLPTKVILCASGKINDSAREHILNDTKSASIIFMDVDDIIPLVDDIMPEFWFNIDSEVTPYLKAFKLKIENEVQLFTKSELLSSNIAPVAASEEMFVSLRLYRYVLQSKMIRRNIKFGGHAEQVPALEEFPVTGLSSKPHRKILILGSAGMGKTTSLLRIAYMMCEKGLNDLDNIKIPIFLRAQEIAQSGSSELIDICAAKTMELTKSLNSSFTSKDLNAGNVFLLIDALDEIPDRGQQISIVNKTLEFHSIYPACQIIITSRDYSYINEIEQLRGFVEYKLCPISLKQAEKIVHNFTKKASLPIEKSSEILRRIQDVHGMELNPLLVTVFAATTDYSRSDIPANITELFKKFTELMLGRWDASKGMALQHQAPLKDFILRHVAFEMHRRRVTKLSIDEFKLISSKELESRGYKTDVEQLNDEMLYRSGLFRIHANDLEFRHLMLQEFFAGRGIPSLGILENLIVDDWWRRSIVFYFGENPGDDSAFIKIKTSLMIKTPAEIFKAMITLGLSLQASYLVKVDSKIPTFIWLIKNLSEVQRSYEHDVVSLAKYPLNKFIMYYLLSREAVALNIIGTYIHDIVKGLKEQSKTKTLSDLEEFWLIIGLIETGALIEAERLVRKFNPSDLRLLLGIHLSCFLIQYTRITSKTEKQNAEKICNLFDSRIISLRKQLQDEFKSELLEIRQDKIGVDTSTRANGQKNLPQPPS